MPAASGLSSSDHKIIAVEAAITEVLRLDADSSSPRTPLFLWQIGSVVRRLEGGYGKRSIDILGGKLTEAGLKGLGASSLRKAAKTAAELTLKEAATLSARGVSLRAAGILANAKLTQHQKQALLRQVEQGQLIPMDLVMRIRAIQTKTGKVRKQSVDAAQRQCEAGLDLLERALQDHRQDVSSRARHVLKALRKRVMG